MTLQGVRMERGSGVNVSKTDPGPICTQQVWHLSVKTSHHAKAHPLCQSSSPPLRGKGGESISIRGGGGAAFIRSRCSSSVRPSRRSFRESDRTVFIQLVELELIEPGDGKKQKQRVVVGKGGERKGADGAGV